MAVTVEHARTEGDRTMAKIRLNKRSQVTIPKAIVEQLHLEEGDQLQVSLDEDGRIILEPTVAVPRSQAWFWTEKWQAEEREAEEDIRAGRYDVIRNADDLDKYFEALKNDED